MVGTELAPPETVLTALSCDEPDGTPKSELRRRGVVGRLPTGRSGVRKLHRGRAGELGLGLHTRLPEGRAEPQPPGGRHKPVAAARECRGGHNDEERE